MTRRGRGEGSVYKRKSDGRWVAVIDYGIEHGRRDRKVLYGSTKTEVLNKQRAELKRRRPTRAHAGHQHTVKSWMQEYLVDIAKPAVRPQTFASYESKVNQYVIPLIGRHRLDLLEPRHIRRMYQRMREPCPEPNDKGQCRHHPSHGLSESTIRQTHVILARALKIAVREKLIPEAETANVDPPSTKQAQRPHLTTPQADLLLASVTDEPDAARWYVALLLGIRQGEALALPWGAVDLARQSVTIARTLVRANGTMTYGEPKSDAGNRVITMTADRPMYDRIPTLFEVARAAHIQTHGREPEPLDLVWAQPNGKPLDPSKDRKRWKQLLEAAGLPNVSLHSARQSAASRMEQNGMGERLAAEILGHSNVAMTYRYQRGAGIENQRKALEG